MVEFFSKLLTSEIKTRILIAVWLSCGAALVAPKSWRTWLHLESVVSEYGHFIGFALLFASVLLSFDLAAIVRSWWTRRAGRKKATEAAMQRVRLLDRAEKGVLREFFLFGKMTRTLPLEDPVVAGLLNAGVIVLVGTMAERTIFGTLVPCRIPDQVVSELTPEILELPADHNNVSDEEMRWIDENRPAFARKLAEFEALKHGRLGF